MKQLVSSIFYVNFLHTVDIVTTLDISFTKLTVS